MLGRGEPLVATVGAARVAERAVVIPAPGGDVFGVLCVPADGSGGRSAPGSGRRGDAQRGRPAPHRTEPQLGGDGAPLGGRRVCRACGSTSAGRRRRGRAARRRRSRRPTSMTPRAPSRCLPRSAGCARRGSPTGSCVTGLCAGAYWAYHAALADPSVAGLGLINLNTLRVEPDARRSSAPAARPSAPCAARCGASSATASDAATPSPGACARSRTCERWRRPAVASRSRPAASARSSPSSTPAVARSTFSSASMSR